MQLLHSTVLLGMAVVVPVTLLPIVNNNNIVVVVTAGHNDDRGVEVEAGNVWRIAMAAVAAAVVVEERDLGAEAEVHRTIKVIIRINQNLVNIGAAAVVENAIGRVPGIKSAAGGIIIEDGTIVVRVVVVGVIRVVVMVIIEGMALPHNIAPIVAALEDREEEDTIEEAVRVVVRG